MLNLKLNFEIFYQKVRGLGIKQIELFDNLLYVDLKII